MTHPTCKTIQVLLGEKSQNLKGKKKRKERRRKEEGKSGLLFFGQNCVVAKIAASSDSIVENLRNQTPLDVSIHRESTWIACAVCYSQHAGMWVLLGRARRHGSQDDSCPHWLLQHKLQKIPLHSLQKEILSKAWEVLTSQEPPSHLSLCSCTHHLSQ